MGFKVSCLSTRWISANLRTMKGETEEKSRCTVCESTCDVVRGSADVAAGMNINLVEPLEQCQQIICYST